MIRRFLTGYQIPLLGVTALLPVDAAAAQSAPPEMADDAECMPSREPHECPERCPSFDTCFIDDGDGLIYYRVGEQRFDCEGLDCTAASTTLADYCCQRGEFEPPSGDGGGGGCSLSQPGRASSSGSGAGSWLCVLGLMLARQRGRG